MTRAGTRPPTTRSWRHDWLLRTDAAKPPSDPFGSCRALADELGKVDGVWAGETAELRRLRRDRARSRRGGTKRVCVECGDEHYGPRYRYCSDTCYLLSRLAESTRQRMRQEIAS